MNRSGESLDRVVVQRVVQRQVFQALVRPLGVGEIGIEDDLVRDPMDVEQIVLMVGSTDHIGMLARTPTCPNSRSSGFPLMSSSQWAASPRA